MSDTNGKMSSFVRHWDHEKNFGFIANPDGERDFYVHESEITMDGYRKLDEGQYVEFISHENSRGPVALQVVPHKEYVVGKWQNVEEAIEVLTSVFDKDVCREISVALAET